MSTVSLVLLVGVRCLISLSHLYLLSRSSGNNYIHLFIHRLPYLFIIIVIYLDIYSFIYIIKILKGTRKCSMYVRDINTKIMMLVGLPVSREEGREEGRKEGREGGREVGREGGREGGREEGRKGGREGGRIISSPYSFSKSESRDSGFHACVFH